MHPFAPVSHFAPAAGSDSRSCQPCDSQLQQPSCFSGEHSVAAYPGTGRPYLASSPDDRACSRPEPITQDSAFHRAQACLAGRNPAQDLQLLDDLQACYPVAASFAQRYTWSSLQARRLTPDLVRDTPLDLAAKLQQIDAPLLGRSAVIPVTALLLRDAVAHQQLLIIFKLLKGLQLLQQAGGLDPRTLVDGGGRSLLEDELFHCGPQAEPWLRLVLESGLFDPDQGVVGPPLLLAMEAAPDASSCAILLDYGANPNACNSRGLTPLHACVDDNSLEGQEEKLDCLLAAPGLDPNLFYKAGSLQGTALDRAIFRGNREAVDKLVAHEQTGLDILCPAPRGAGGSVAQVSALGTAALVFLLRTQRAGADGDALAIVQRLAAAGGRLLAVPKSRMTGDAGRPVYDCTEDIDQFVRLLGCECSEQSRSQLQHAISQARTGRMRQAGMGD